MEKYDKQTLYTCIRGVVGAPAMYIGARVGRHIDDHPRHCGGTAGRSAGDLAPIPGPWRPCARSFRPIWTVMGICVALYGHLRGV